MATVGIVVPIYNTGPFLRPTLESIATQTFSDWRCILVDDGSTDGSAEVCDAAARDDSRFHVIHQSNQGISAARNAGLAAIDSCSLLTFMDHDDVWQPHALASLRGAIRDASFIGAHGLADTIDEADRVVGDFRGYMRARSRPGVGRFVALDHTEPTTLGSTLFVNRVYPPGVMLVAREAYEKAGPWDPRFAAVQDWDMLLRLLEQGPIAYVDEPVLLYRRHSSNASGDHRRNVKETRRLHVVAYARLEPTIGKRKLKSWWRQWEKLKLAEAVRALPKPIAFARVLAHAWRYVRAWPSTGPIG